MIPSRVPLILRQWTPLRLFERGAQGLYLDAARLDSIWQDSAATTAPAFGSPVGHWRDLTGSGRNATQSGSNRPVLQRDTLGRPVVQFAGTSAHWMSLNATSLFQNVDSGLITVLGLSNGNNQAFAFWSINTEGGTTRFAAYSGTAGQSISAIARRLGAEASGTVASFGSRTTSAQVCAALVDWQQGTLFARVDGIQSAASSLPTTGTTSNTESLSASIGTILSGGTSLLTGHMYALVAVTPAPPLSEIQRLEAFLARRAGV